MKLIQKIFSVIVAVFVCISIIPLNVSASVKLDFQTDTSGSGNTISVKKITYEEETSSRFAKGAGGNLSKLEVDFLTDVIWDDSAKVSSVKDNKGRKYRGYLHDMDDDGCDIIISNMKYGRTYTIVIDGIKSYDSSHFCSLALKVKVPKRKSSVSNLKISKVTVEDSSGEVDVEFASKVIWKKNSKVVSVKDNKGKSYKGYLTDRDDDECEVFIENMKSGRTYKIKISGIKARGSASFQTITITAKVPAHSQNLSVKKVEYEEDDEDGRMEWTVNFDFNKNVIHTDDSYIMIRDAAGKTYSSENSFVKWEEDECEVYLSEALTNGQQYTYEIVNVKAVQGKQFITLNGSFTAYDD